jgi:2-keto-3-deoxy-L-rhamnonate aldolase RhmA
MLKDNKFRALLEAGKPTFGTRILSSWPTVTEAAGATAQLDYIEFLAEYAPVNQYDLENIARAAELHDMATMIKVDFQNRGFVAQKALASGFQAILFADHHSAEEVQETLRLVRPEHPACGGRMGYPNRRWIGFRSEAGSQQEFVDMSVRSVMAFMIEKKEAVENIEEICAVPGVDMVQFGPYDYALSCGYNRADDPERTKAAERRVIETALKHGVRPRVEINDYSEAQPYIKMGVKDFNVGNELRVMARFWTEQGKALREMVAKG